MTEPGRAPIPFELLRWQLAEKYGWTLEYIDSLSLDTLNEHFQITDGMMKSRGGK